MKKQNALWTLEIIIIALIPAFTLGFDVIENSDFYKSIFNYEPIETAIVYRFGIEYEQLENSQEEDLSDFIIKKAHPEDFERVWKFIKDHKKVELRDEDPLMIGRYSIKNAPFVMMNNERFVLVPDSVPIIVSYCQPLELASGKCSDVIPVGTLEDFKNWYQEEKSTFRNNVNLILGFSAIIIAGILWNMDRKKSFLLLND